MAILVRLAAVSILASGCGAGAAPAGAPAPAPAPSEAPKLDRAALELALTVERALDQRRVAGTEALRAREEALVQGATLSTLPRPSPAEIAAVVTELGLDPEAVARARQRIEELTLLEQLRGERASDLRFRSAHLESLERARDAAPSEAERAHFASLADDVRKDLDAARKRDADAFSSIAPELALLHAHAAELGLELKPLQATDEDAPEVERPAAGAAANDSSADDASAPADPVDHP